MFWKTTPLTHLSRKCNETQCQMLSKINSKLKVLEATVLYILHSGCRSLCRSARIANHSAHMSFSVWCTCRFQIQHYAEPNKQLKFTWNLNLWLFQRVYRHIDKYAVHTSTCQDLDAFHSQTRNMVILDLLDPFGMGSCDVVLIHPWILLLQTRL